MPPEDINTRAEKIGRDLDKGDAALASAALLEELDNMSAADFQKFARTISDKEKKGIGLDLIIDKELNPLGTVIALQSKDQSDSFRRNLTICNGTTVARIWDPLTKEKDKFLATEIKDISNLLDTDRLDEASARINALLRLNKPLGYGSVFDALKSIEAKDSKGNGFDLTLTALKKDIALTPDGRIASYRDGGHQILLHRDFGGESMRREVGIVDTFSAKETWKPTKGAQESNDLTNPYFNRYLKSPLYIGKNSIR